MNIDRKGIKKSVAANTDVLRYKILQALQHKNKRIEELENIKRLLETENKRAFDTIGRLLEEKETMKKEYEVQLELIKKKSCPILLKKELAS